MKKIILGMLSFLLLISSLSCSSQSLKLNVLEVESLNYDNTFDVNHNFDVTNEMLVWEDNLVSNTKAIEVMGSTLSLYYQDTCKYPIGDIQVQRYTIENDQSEDSFALILENGKICALLNHPVTTIDIEKTASADVVQKSVEAALSEMIPFEQYQHVDVFCSFTDTTNGFGGYHYIWYNQIGNYMLDGYAKLSVTDDGEVHGLWIRPFTPDYTTLDLDDEVILSTVEDELASIYNTDTTSLSDYNVKSALLTMYDGKPYIDFVLGVHFCVKATGDVWSEACKLLVEVPTLPVS